MTRFGYKDATTDPDTIRAWWTQHPAALIGRPTGATTGIVVLDVDDGEGRVGGESLATLVSQHGQLPDTVEALTPRGGRHLYFRHPGITIPCSASKVGKDLDIRGDGGYVISPPSALPDGRSYQWEGSGDPDEGATLADLPPWLLRMIQARTQDPPAPKSETGHPVIERFNQAHDPRAILEAHGYRSQGENRWVAPDSASRTPGVVLLDSGKVFSHHGSDPLGTGHAHDAFSLFSLLNHGGDTRAAIAAAEKLLPDPAEEAPVKLRQCDTSRIWAADLSPPAFLVDPLIPRGHVTLFGGHGGSGKTTVALALAAHVAAGRSWAGLPVARGKVLLASFEDGEELILWRLRRICEEYALNPREVGAQMAVIDATEAAGIMMEHVDGGVRRVVPTSDGAALVRMIDAQRPDLVIVDNASDAYDGDENHRRQVRAFMRYLSAAVKGYGGAILLLAHIDKNAARYGSGGNSYSGTTAWHNSARSRLALVEDQLRHEKLNVGKALENAIPLTWTARAVPVPAGSAGAALTATVRDAADDAAVLACMRAAAEAGADVPTGDTGPCTTWHALSVYPECPAHLKSDKARFREAVARLVRGGTLAREDYRNPSRKIRQRYVVKVRQFAPIQTGAELEQTGANTPAPLCANSSIGVWGLERRTSDGDFEPAQTGAFEAVEVLV